MILPTDVPTRAQVERLPAAREPASVSVYLPTSPASRGDAERIELGNLAVEAARRLREAGTARTDVSATREQLADLVDEIARRVWLTGGGVLAVRRDDVPGSGSLAPILRYGPSIEKLA